MGGPRGRLVAVPNWAQDGGSDPGSARHMPHDVDRRRGRIDPQGSCSSQRRAFGGTDREDNRVGKETRKLLDQLGINGGRNFCR